MKTLAWVLVAGAILVMCSSSVQAGSATEQQKDLAIDKGLQWLSTQYAVQDANRIYYPYGYSGTIGATASTLMTFVDKGYAPYTNFVDYQGNNRGDIVGRMSNYLFSRATQVALGTQTGLGWYEGGEDIYNSGLAVQAVYALGQQRGRDTLIGGTSPLAGLTYKQAMQQTVNWFSWAQNPDGGWRYVPNGGASDNSTAQWGSLALIYGAQWGCTIQDPTNPGWDVKAKLNGWINTIQNLNGTPATNPNHGASGYTYSTEWNNVSKTGGLLLEMLAVGRPLADPGVQAALAYINRQWNTYANGTWDGNYDHPYAVWAVYKALQGWGKLVINDNGTPLNPSDDFFVGTGMSNAPGGVTIGQDWGPQTSLNGDWYSRYTERLLTTQSGDGHWDGYSYWGGSLATAWDISILNASPVIQPVQPVIPEPLTCIGAVLGVMSLGGYLRRRMGAGAA